MLLGSYHTWFQIQEYSRPFSECHFVRATRKVKALATDAYLRDLYLKTTNPLRAYNFTLQHMAHSTDFSNPEEALATNLKGNILVYMAWCDLQYASINLITPDEGRRYGFYR